MRIAFSLGLLLMLLGCVFSGEGSGSKRASESIGEEESMREDDGFTVWRLYDQRLYRVEGKVVSQTLVSLDRKNFFEVSLVDSPIILWLEENGTFVRALVLHPNSKPRNGVELLPVLVERGVPEVDWTKRVVSPKDLSVEMHEIAEDSFKELVELAGKALKGRSLEAGEWGQGNQKLNGVPRKRVEPQ
jgi:hypothetical protein